MKFTKMQGIGNDYIYVNCYDQIVESPSQTAINLSKRHYSVGADGLVLICRSDVADAKMRMFNADGSEGKMCGNAIRCVGKYLYDNKIISKTEVSIETKSGIKKLDLILKNNRVEKITVDMGKADFSPQNVPVNTISSWILHPITVFETEYKITALSVGNPHAVCFTTKVDELNLPKIGGFIGSLESFPEGVNVEFAEIISQTHLRMRVWERGSGETFACGTGACAVVSAAIKNGFCSCGNDICVSLLGGDLNINVRADGEIFMTGTATKVYDGEI